MLCLLPTRWVPSPTGLSGGEAFTRQLGKASKVSVPEQVLHQQHPGARGDGAVWGFRSGAAHGAPRVHPRGCSQAQEQLGEWSLARTPVNPCESNTSGIPLAALSVILKTTSSSSSAHPEWFPPLFCKSSTNERIPHLQKAFLCLQQLFFQIYLQKTSLKHFSTRFSFFLFFFLFFSCGIQSIFSLQSKYFSSLFAALFYLFLNTITVNIEAPKITIPATKHIYIAAKKFHWNHLLILITTNTVGFFFKWKLISFPSSSKIHREGLMYSELFAGTMHHSHCGWEPLPPTGT